MVTSLSRRLSLRRKNMTIPELLSQFSDPEIIHTLSVADKLTAGLVATVLGMGITFTALIILQFVIVLMDKLSKQPRKPGTEKSQAGKSTKSSPEPISSANDELIAVISTVIASQLKKPMNNIVIRNIEKIDDPSPVWNRAGVIEQMNSRY
jgi:sodium pump decarboxylase gamma subunit